MNWPASLPVGRQEFEPRTYPLIPQSGRAGFEPAILRLTAGRITIMLSTKLRDTTIVLLANNLHLKY